MEFQYDNCLGNSTIFATAKLFPYLFCYPSRGMWWAQSRNCLFPRGREGWREGWMLQMWQSESQNQGVLPCTNPVNPLQRSCCPAPKELHSYKVTNYCPDKNHPVERATSVLCSRTGKKLTATWLITVWQLGKLNDSMDFRNSPGTSWIKDVDLLE